MAHHHVGEIAALTTAACWVVSALAFARAGRQVGSLAVNLIRLLLAFPLLAIVTYALRGRFLPLDADASAWQWLSLSGFVGFVFGDMCLFRAYVLIGARLSSLVMSTSPIFAAVIGWLVLDENMTMLAALGMATTCVGVSWAISAREDRSVEGKERLWGVLLGIGGAVGQAGGLVLSKQGMADYDPFAATQIRILAAIVGWLVIFAVSRRWSSLVACMRNVQALKLVALGAVFGPVIGVSLSLLAVQRANTGVAASIMSITPILIIPFSVILFRERVSVRGIFGAVAAVAGVIILFLQ